MKDPVLFRDEIYEPDYKIYDVKALINDGTIICFEIVTKYKDKWDIIKYASNMIDDDVLVNRIIVLDDNNIFVDVKINF